MSGKPMAGCGPYLINRPESEPDGAIPYKPPSPELVEAMRVLNEVEPNLIADFAADDRSRSALKANIAAYGRQVAAMPIKIHGNYPPIGPDLRVLPSRTYEQDKSGFSIDDWLGVRVVDDGVALNSTAHPGAVPIPDNIRSKLRLWGWEQDWTGRRDLYEAWRRFNLEQTRLGDYEALQEACYASMAVSDDHDFNPGSIETGELTVHDDGTVTVKYPNGSVAMGIDTAVQQVTELQPHTGYCGHTWMTDHPETACVAECPTCSPRLTELRPPPEHEGKKAKAVVAHADDVATSYASRVGPWRENLVLDLRRDMPNSRVAQAAVDRIEELESLLGAARRLADVHERVRDSNREGMELYQRQASRYARMLVEKDQIIDRLTTVSEPGSHPYTGPSEPDPANPGKRRSVPDPVHERVHHVIGDILSGKVIPEARRQVQEALKGAPKEPTRAPDAILRGNKASVGMLEGKPC